MSTDALPTDNEAPPTDNEAPPTFEPPVFARLQSIEEDLRNSPGFQFITRPDLYQYAKVCVGEYVWVSIVCVGGYVWVGMCG